MHGSREMVPCDIELTIVTIGLQQLTSIIFYFAQVNAQRKICKNQANEHWWCQPFFPLIVVANPAALQLLHAI